ncbi:MAG: DNA repair protein RadC [Bacilli bacterium]|nr:DNA repair protein RadC [Bacilli bacterium]
MILKELPNSERPRERVLEKGVKNVSTLELLAILLRTGSKKYSVLETAHLILSKISKLQDLNDLSLEELKEIDGIGTTKAITILSAIELGKRINQLDKNDISFNEAFQVYEYMKDELKNLKEEHLYVLYLNTKGKLIDKKLLSIGTVNQTLIDSKIIFKWAYKLSASAFILVHNHPSGDATPSKADIQITDIINKQAKMLGFVLVDHIVIGYTFYSLMKNKKIL